MHILFRRLVLFIVNGMPSAPTWRRMQGFRAWLLRCLGLRLDGPGEISENLYILDGRRLQVGRNYRLGSFLRVWDFSDIKIGDNVLCSHNVTLIAGNHNPVDLTPVQSRIVIGDNVWIGVGVTIVGPVKIGDEAIVGAGAVVVHDIAPRAIVGGCPAKLIRFR